MLNDAEHAWEQILANIFIIQHIAIQLHFLVKFSDSLWIYCFVFLLKSSLQNRQLLCRSIYFLCMIKVSQLDMKRVLLKLISLVFSMATVKSQVDGNSTSACSGASSGFTAIHVPCIVTLVFLWLAVAGLYVCILKHQTRAGYKHV